MGPFLLGFLISAIIGMSLVYTCYSKRELTEKKLRLNISNLEHNLVMLQKESDLKIEGLTIDLKKAKEENRKSLGTIDSLQRSLNKLKKDLDECNQQLEEFQ